MATGDAAELRSDVCPACEYNLAGLRAEKCPECGSDIAREFQRRGWPKPAWPVIAVWMMSFAGLAIREHHSGLLEASFLGVLPWLNLSGIAGAIVICAMFAFRRQLRASPSVIYWLLLLPGAALCAWLAGSLVMLAIF